MRGARYVGFAMIALVGVVLYQHLWLENLPEKRSEDLYADLSRMPASGAVPLYLGTLFLGAFRAVAIDYLWISYEEAKENRNYYELTQLSDLISYLQAKNEEVWIYLGWDSAYNVVEEYWPPQLYPREWWRWVKYGLKKVREGVDAITWSPHLKWWLAWALHHKASWDWGKFQWHYLRLFMQDLEWQRMMMRPRGLKKPITPFEMAIYWFRKAIQDLKAYKHRTGREYYSAPMGLVIQPEATECMIRGCYLLQVMFFWLTGNFKACESWLEEAIKQARMILQKYPHSYSIRFHRKYLEFFEALKVILSELRALDPKDRQGQLAISEKIQALLVKYPTLDNDYLRNWYGGVRRHYWGDDPYEFNDIPMFPAPCRTQEQIKAILLAGLKDKDFYQFFLSPQRGYKVVLSRGDGPEVLVKLYNLRGKEVSRHRWGPDRKSLELPWKVDKEGLYMVSIEAPDGAQQDLPYTLKVQVK